MLVPWSVVLGRSKKLQHTPRAHPFGNPPATPTMKGLPNHSPLVKGCSGCVAVRSVETTLESWKSFHPSLQLFHESVDSCGKHINSQHLPPSASLHMVISHHPYKRYGVLSYHIISFDTRRKSSTSWYGNQLTWKLSLYQLGALYVPRVSIHLISISTSWYGKNDPIDMEKIPGCSMGLIKVSIHF